jgi:hypothetical protein
MVTTLFNRLLKYDVFKTQAPTFSIAGHARGLPSFPGCIATFALAILTFVYFLFQAMQVGEFKQIFTYKVPNPVNSKETAFDVENIYKMAFFVSNYHDQSFMYDDTSLIEWTVIRYETEPDGTQIEAQVADIRKCD